MKTNDNASLNLPFLFDESLWGIPKNIEECCPGVFYLTTKSVAKAIGKELYAISKNYKGNIISKETMDYGIESNGVLLFEIGRDGSGAKLIDYEIQRYKVKSGLALVSSETLYCTAIYAAELFPKYFGGLIPPRYTPHGFTVRVKTVTNGIFFLETDQCRWLLAISYPIWEAELNEELKRLGTICSHDLRSGDEATQYLFFTQENFPPIIYELLKHEHYQEFMKFISYKEALMNAIWEQTPLYAIRHNLSEQLGMGTSNLLNPLLASLGCDTLSDYGKPEDLEETRLCAYIYYQPTLTGQSYLLLPM